MAYVPSQVTKPSKPQVLLIPWDPVSLDHVQRLVQQRIECGWDHEAVESWKAKQERGELNLQWIVLENSDPEKDAKLLKHAEAYPLEQEPLLDSALSFGGKPRTIPLPQRTFVPVGHICLGSVLTEYERRGYAKNEEGLYWISNFYVSRALQGIGLGTAAMNTVENLAISEPLNAKILALNAINKIDPEREEKYKALGLVIPLVSVPGLKVEFANDVKFSNQEWYERRGYRVYTNVESLFSKVDSTGKTWSWNAVFMKKEI